MSSPHDRPTNAPGGCQCERCDVIFVGAEHHRLCAVCEKASNSKPTDEEIIASMMEWDNGLSSVTYVMRNRLGRNRCTTAWLRAQLRRLEKAGKVRMSPRQTRADMIQWDVVK